MAVGRLILRRAEKPFITITGNARQYVLCRGQLLLCLLLLEAVNIQAAADDIIDNGIPGEGCAYTVPYPSQGGLFRGREEKPVSFITGLTAVVSDILQHRLGRQAPLLFRVEILWRKNYQAKAAVVWHISMGCKGVDTIEK